MSENTLDNMPKVQICDLTKIIPDERIIKMPINKVHTGLFWDILRKFGYKDKPIVKDIDVSKVSARTTFEVDKYLAEIGGATNDNNFDVVEEKGYEILVDVCKPSFPEITKDIIMDNLTTEQMMEMLNFVLIPFLARAAGVTDATKKAVAAFLKEEN